MNILYKIVKLALAAGSEKMLTRDSGLSAVLDQRAPSSMTSRNPEQDEDQSPSFRNDGVAPEIWVWMMMDDPRPWLLHAVPEDAGSRVTHAHERRRIPQNTRRRKDVLSAARGNGGEMPECTWLASHG